MSSRTFNSGLFLGVVALVALIGFSIWSGQPSGLVGQSPSPSPTTSLAGPAPAGAPQPGGIAYGTSGRDGHLAMVDPTTGRARPLTRPLTELLARSGCGPALNASVAGEGGFVEDLAWSPDGRALAFQLAAGLGVNDAGQVRCGLYIVSSDGTTLQRLLAPMQPDSGSPFFYSPAWSPDGSQIAVALEQSIALVQLDGTGPVDLGSPCEGCAPTYFSSIGGWSPDGSQVAAQFAVARIVDLGDGHRIRDFTDATYYIAVVDVATAEWTVLWSSTREPAAGGETGLELLGWLLDGRVAAGSNNGVFAADADQPDEWSLLPFRGARDPRFDPDGLGRLDLWSPDQTRDALTSDYETDGLRVRDLLTGQITTIADWEVHGGVAAWSPDGAQLAVVRNEGREIWLIGADGSGPRRLVNDSATIRVAWQPVWPSDESE
jgi:dipeptidyl aminopeptidase/acylaminoacyl peptidase